MAEIPAPPSAALTIAPEERGLATITHLSGLAGYIIPFGGILVPIIIWMVKSESLTISSIAKQAIILNVVAFVLIITGIVMFITIILIPVAILLVCGVMLVALIFPIVGAIKANGGEYFRYPLVGTQPPVRLA